MQLTKRWKWSGWNLRWRSSDLLGFFFCERRSSAHRHDLQHLSRVTSFSEEDNGYNAQRLVCCNSTWPKLQWRASPGDLFFRENEMVLSLRIVGMKTKYEHSCFWVPCIGDSIGDSNLEIRKSGHEGDKVVCFRFCFWDCASISYSRNHYIVQADL